MAWTRDEERDNLYNIINGDENTNIAPLSLPDLPQKESSLWDSISNTSAIDMGKSFINGLAIQPARGVLGTVRGITENVGMPVLNEISEDLLNSSPLQEFKVDNRNVATDLANAGGNVLGTVGTAFFAGPGAAAGLAGATIGGNDYNELREKGVSPGKALGYSAADAAITGAIERAGLPVLIGKAGPLKGPGMVRNFVRGGVTEGVTEGLQEYPNEILPAMAMGKDWDIGKVSQNAAYAGALAFPFGGLGGAAGEYVRRRNEEQADQQEAQEAETTDDTPQISPVDVQSADEFLRNYSATVDTSTDEGASQVNTIEDILANGSDADRVNLASQIGGWEAPSQSPAMQMMGFFVNEMGMSPEVAAGFVGNYTSESGDGSLSINPLAVNGKSGAFGIAQWLGSRKDELIKFAEDNGLDPNDWNTQLLFTKYELQNGEADSLKKILGAQNVDEAADLVDQFYERSEGTPEIRERKRNAARTVLNAWNGMGNTASKSGNNSSGNSIPIDTPETDAVNTPAPAAEGFTEEAPAATENQGEQDAEIENADEEPSTYSPDGEIAEGQFDYVDEQGRPRSPSIDRYWKKINETPTEELIKNSELVQKVRDAINDVPGAREWLHTTQMSGETIRRLGKAISQQSRTARREASGRIREHERAVQTRGAVASNAGNIPSVREDLPVIRNEPANAPSLNIRRPVGTGRTRTQVNRPTAQQVINGQNLSDSDILARAMSGDPNAIQAIRAQKPSVDFHGQVDLSTPEERGNRYSGYEPSVDASRIPGPVQTPQTITYRAQNPNRQAGSNVANYQRGNTAAGGENAVNRNVVGRMGAPLDISTMLPQNGTPSRTEIPASAVDAGTKTAPAAQTSESKKNTTVPKIVKETNDGKTDKDTESKGKTAEKVEESPRTPGKGQEKAPEVKKSFTDDHFIHIDLGPAGVTSRPLIKEDSEEDSEPSDNGKQYKSETEKTDGFSYKAILKDGTITVKDNTRKKGVVPESGRKEDITNYQRTTVSVKVSEITKKTAAAGNANKALRDLIAGKYRDNVSSLIEKYGDKNGAPSSEDMREWWDNTGSKSPLTDRKIDANVSAVKDVYRQYLKDNPEIVKRLSRETAETFGVRTENPTNSGELEVNAPGKKDAAESSENKKPINWENIFKKEAVDDLIKKNDEGDPGAKLVMSIIKKMPMAPEDKNKNPVDSFADSVNEDAVDEMIARDIAGDPTAKEELDLFKDPNLQFLKDDPVNNRENKKISDYSNKFVLDKEPVTGRKDPRYSFAAVTYNGKIVIADISKKKGPVSDKGYKRENDITLYKRVHYSVPIDEINEAIKTGKQENLTNVVMNHYMLAVDNLTKDMDSIHEEFPDAPSSKELMDWWTKNSLAIMNVIEGKEPASKINLYTIRDINWQRRALVKAYTQYLADNPNEYEKVRDGIDSLLEDKKTDKLFNNATIEEKAEPAAEKEDTADAGRMEGSARPVEVRNAGEGSGNGEAGRKHGGSSAEPSKSGGAAQTGISGNGTKKTGSAVQRSGKSGDGNEESGTGRIRNDERGTEKPVKESITPKIDKIEDSVEEHPNMENDKKDYTPKPLPRRTSKQRADDNVAAIKLLNKIESENRKATPAEQEELAKYSGWGGLSGEFAIRGKELSSLMTKEEYDRLRNSTTDAFYTPPYVVGSMWKLAERLGFKGGRVLDPSTGTGIFFGLMPKSIRAKSSMTGTELDPITSRIASQLYQTANIQNMNYTDLQAADGYFDIAISNVPFGSSRPNDSRYNKFKYKLHNYFFAKSVDKVRPGGLIMFVTSRDTMDGTGDASTLRRNLDNSTEFVGAIRLPGTVFGESNTDVTTDIVVLRKLNPGEKPVKNKWGEVEDVVIPGSRQNRPDHLNKYFSENPDMAIGYRQTKPDWRSGRDVLFWDVKNPQDKNAPEINVEKELGKRISKFPKDIYTKKKAAPTNTIKAVEQISEAKTGSYAGDIVTADNGVVGHVVIDDSGKKVIKPFPKAAQKKMRDYMKIQEALDDLSKEQNNPQTTDKVLEEKRKKLNDAYDSFVKDYGYLHSKKNKNTLMGVNGSGRVLALENYSENTKAGTETATKADIFTKRTVGTDNHVVITVPSDALAASLQEEGHPDIPYMAKLLGKSEDEVISELGDSIIKDPVTESYETRDEYLSGNIRQKLQAAEDAAKSNPEYKKNVEALKKIMPRDLKPEEISVEMGASWMSPKFIKQFVCEKLNLSPDYVDISFDSLSSSWKINFKNEYAKAINKANKEYGTKERYFSDILFSALNLKRIEVKPKTFNNEPPTAAAIEAANIATTEANNKVKRMKKDFVKWLWSDADRAKSALETYNNTFNSEVLREYDGSFLTLPGKSLTTPDLNPHQKNAIWRIVNERSTLIAHCVGAGKTWTMQAAGMELRRMGLARKIVYTVPKNTVYQFEKEFLQLYPNARILVLTSDNLPDVPKKEKVKDGKKIPLTEKEKTRIAVNTAKRNEMLQRIKTEDWDAIIMSHETFKRIPMSDEAYRAYYEEQLDLYREQLEAAKSEGKKYSQKDIEDAIKKLETKLGKLINEQEKFDVGSDTFETLGIDQLFVDEADMFKNLEFPTKLVDVHGIKNNGSQKSEDLYTKIRYLTNNPSTHGVVFATGTPVSNTVAEAYTMCRYLAQEKLEALGLRNFDDFAKEFFKIEEGIEPKPTGDGFRIATMVNGINNLPEFKKIWRSFCDVKMIDDLPYIKKGLPKAERKAIAYPESEWYQNYLKNEISSRVASITGRAKKGGDNMLKIMNDLRLATLDPRLIDPNVPTEDANGRIAACANEVYSEYKESNATKGAQLVFCDLSTPKDTDTEEETAAEKAEDAANDKKAVSVYQSLKNQLVELGIPADEIKFVHDAKNDKAKQALFEDVRSGRVRVLIGSTTKMGAGTNMQNKLVALHHLQVPWRPRDLEQREGRILRRGNENENVRIYTYGAPGSFDAVMWSKVTTKEKNIGPMMNSDMNSRSIEYQSEVTPSHTEMIAMCSGDQSQIVLSNAQNRVDSLRLDKQAWERSVKEAQKSISELPTQIANYKQGIENAKKDIAERKGSKDKVVVEIGGTTYTGNKEANDAFAKVTASVMSSFAKASAAGRASIPIPVGHVAGFKILVSARGNQPIVNIQGYNTYTAQTASAVGAFNEAFRGPETRMSNLKQMVTTAEVELEQAKKTVKSTFDQEEELREAEQTLADVEQKIRDQVKESGRPAADSTENEQEPAEGETNTEAPAEDDTKYSISDRSDSPVVQYTDEELSGQVKAAHPNAENWKRTENGVEFDTPNGMHWQYDFTDGIAMTKEQWDSANRDYGGGLTGNERVQGKVTMVDRNAVVTLSRDSDEGTADHEAFHVAMAGCLTDKEKSALLSHAKKQMPGATLAEQEEWLADDYKEWQKKRREGRGSMFGRLYQKIQDFAEKMLGLMHENPHNVYRKLSTGEVFSRPELNESDKKIITKMSIRSASADYMDKLAKKMRGKTAADFERENPNIHITEPKGKGTEISYELVKMLTAGSPSRSTNPVVKTLWRWARSAMDTQTRLEREWTKRHADLLRTLKTDKEVDELNSLNWEGDSTQHEFTDAELKAKGTSENVQKAYKALRSLMKDIYTSLNDVKTMVHIETKTGLTEAEVEEMSRVKFFNIMKKSKGDDGKYTVTFSTPDYYKSTKEMSAEEIENLKSQKDRVQITKVHALPQGRKRVTFYRQADPIANRAGYIPHIFHEQMIACRVLDKKASAEVHTVKGITENALKKLREAEGVTIRKSTKKHRHYDVEYTQDVYTTKIVGSAQTLSEAVEKASKMSTENGEQYLISPKEMLSDMHSHGVLVGDADYDRIVMRAVVKYSFTLPEARDMVKNIVKRSNKHRFNGSFMHRTGAEGYEEDSRWVIQQHIRNSARYVAMEPFKYQSLNLFERTFGGFDKNYPAISWAGWSRGYINAIMNQPMALEKAVNSLLEKVPGFKERFSDPNHGRGSRALAGDITSLLSVAKLGVFNASSAMLNVFQLNNLPGFIGFKATAAGIKHAIRPTAADKKVLEAANVEADVGLDSVDGVRNLLFGSPVTGGKSFLGMYSYKKTAAGRTGDYAAQLFGKTMMMFSATERLARRSAILGAYWKARADGLSNARALEYARDVNDWVNFDYSVVDEPNVFRQTRGTILGDMALQFRKFPVKQLGLMSEFLPGLGNTGKTKSDMLKFWMPQIIFSGLFGFFPAEELLMQIWGGLTDDDKEASIKQAMMEYANDHPQYRSLVMASMYGIFGAATNVDISKRVGMADVVPQYNGISSLFGPAGSTAAGIFRAFQNADPVYGMRQLSPSLGNLWTAYVGESKDSKGNVSQEFDSFQRLLKAAGFRTADESLSSDMKRISNNYKSQKKTARQEARDAYIADPSAENMKKLRDLNYTPSQIKAILTNAKKDAKERAKDGMTQQERKDLKGVIDFVNE